MDWLQDPLEQLQWGVLHWVATLFWNIDRLILMGAVLIHTIRKWITQPSGIINMVTTYLLQDEGSASLKTYIAGAILLALLLASFVFILRPLIGSDHNPVDLRKVFLWLAVGGYLFSSGPAFFSDMEQFRAQLSSSAYQVASSVNGNVGGGGGGGQGYNNTQGEVPVGGSEPFSPTVQLFPNTTHIYNNSRQPEYTGVDVAAAYLFATQEDVNGTVNGGTGLPEAFENQYFTNNDTRPWPSNFDDTQRQAALSNALTGVVRISTGVVPSTFAIQQALIFLALAIAAAVLIFSLPISLVFAFFTATEVIALSVVRAYVSLLVKTYVVAMILAIFMGFLKFWADSQNWVAFLGMSLLILFFSWQLAHLAVQTITQSLNVVTQAIGEATGTQMAYFDPIKMAGQTVGQAAGLAATVGIAAATGGAGMAAGSLISGIGGMGIPGMKGMQTLGYGLTMDAVRNRRAGQRAEEELERSNQGEAAAEEGGAPGAPGAPGALGAGALTGPGTTVAARSTQPLAAPSLPSPLAAPSLPSPLAATSVLSTHSSGTPSSSSNGSRHTGAPNNSAKTASMAMPVPVSVQDGALTVDGNGKGKDKSKHDSPTLLRVRPAATPGKHGKDASNSTTMGFALAALMKSDGRGELPAALQTLPRAAQTALTGIASRGHSRHQPREVAAIADATRTVSSVMQYQNIPPTTVPSYFLGPDGRVDLNSKGVRDTLEQAGLSSWANSEDPQQRADLAHIIGVGLQLERTYNAGDIQAAIGQAVAEGGTADTAADVLEMSPSAWGGRYGSIQSVITQSPAYGLNSAGDVQSFIALVQQQAQQHSIEELGEGQVSGLSVEQQALLDRVRTRAQEIAVEARVGVHGAEDTIGTSLHGYLRDVRSVPARLTASAVPVAPMVPMVPIVPIVPSVPAPLSPATPAKSKEETTS